jgi:hypothetical protein
VLETARKPQPKCITDFTDSTIKMQDIICGIRETARKFVAGCEQFRLLGTETEK